MDFKQMRYFCTVAEEGQVTKAAKKLHMAQPPLSQQLKRLEESFNCTLFEKDERKMVLTPVGEVLYERAKGLLEDLEDTITEVKETSEGIRGKLSIGSNKSCFSHLPPQLLALRENHPNLTYQLREGDTYTLSEMLLQREIELALVRLPADTTKFSMLPLPSEPYVAVIPASWESTAEDRHTLSLSELKNTPLMLLHRVSGAGQFELIVQECERHGFKPNIICECPDASMLLSLVNAGVGATIIPKASLAGFAYPNIRSFHLEDIAFEADLGFIWKKDQYLTKAAEQLLQRFEVT
ncbi:DNA-binding transcriptional LysR family regulator [Salsuginibacillus halophilus]|uniref:DNA-binding transcriptional LysR family regulator n=1 Tax=Salsuginibacillus halophilus TaxID=517424 RepID=A0A2P8HQG8_9BACI|nr:LysR family transcriptional regulator [Salsuginibacillus halophilus]PSL48471.1 DNA-binding transcriptional LysR family regulator [Salsuginibacillus halophilus]